MTPHVLTPLFLCLICEQTFLKLLLYSTSPCIYQVPENFWKLYLPELSSLIRRFSSAFFTASPSAPGCSPGASLPRTNFIYTATLKFRLIIRITRALQPVSVFLWTKVYSGRLYTIVYLGIGPAIRLCGSYVTSTSVYTAINSIDSGPSLPLPAHPYFQQLCKLL